MKYLCFDSIHLVDCAAAAEATHCINVNELNVGIRYMQYCHCMKMKIIIPEMRFKWLIEQRAIGGCSFGCSSTMHNAVQFEWETRRGNVQWMHK